jgi:hypothetical protein
VTKPQPSLEDLGLDSPAEKSPFGKAFDNYQPSADEFAKTWVDSVQMAKPAPKSGVAAVLSFIIPGAGQVIRGRILAGFFSFFVIAGLYAISLGFFPALLLAIPLHLMNVYMAYSE